MFSPALEAELEAGRPNRTRRGAGTAAGPGLLRSAHPAVEEVGMFSPALEAELQAALPGAGSYVPTMAQKWGNIRSAAAHIALGEYYFWYEGRRVENEPGDIHTRLLAYWNAAKQRPLFSAIWMNYWSAAFISYVLRQAGAGTDFHYDSRHSHYLHWAIKNAVGSAGRPAAMAVHPVQAHPVNAIKPRVGDVVCQWRDAKPITYDSLAKMPKPATHPMHCDIVTEVEPALIWTVGGNRGPASGVACPPVPKPDTNSGCTVNRGSHALTSAGLLAPLTAVDKNNKLVADWIAVIRIGP